MILLLAIIQSLTFFVKKMCKLDSIIAKEKEYMLLLKKLFHLYCTFIPVLYVCQFDSVTRVSKNQKIIEFCLFCECDMNYDA